LAEQAPGDHPVDRTNGVSNRHQPRSASDSDVEPLLLEQTLADSDDEAASDLDLACADDTHAHAMSREVREHTADQRDQTADRRDQTADERDQTADQRDQTAETRRNSADEREHTADQREHDADQRDQNAATRLGSADERERAANQREQTADERDRTADERDQSAETRLAAADKRDVIADARDLAALARDDAADARRPITSERDGVDLLEDSARALTAGDGLVRAAERRKRDEQLRALAAEQHALAAHDRRAAAQDREQGARERRHALADRKALARQLTITETDPLTGARARAAGLTDLDHELDRCRRTASRLVVAYIDVVGLKTVNDTQGHGAGDELLKQVVALLKTHLRSYDLIIRLAGDEFLCAMSNITLPDARQRFRAIAAALAAAPRPAAISTGFAELAPGQPVAELIACADKEMIESRHASPYRRAQRATDPSR
jgi:diguanylate cyclase (GGDEF)-like protein